MTMRPLDSGHAGRALTGAALAITLPLALVACGSDDPSALAPRGQATSSADTHLVIEVRASKKADTKRFSLTCGSGNQAGGTHPAAGRACAGLEKAAALDKAEDPFAPVPDNAMCTEIYGGPQTATVRGTWEGRQVDATFSRADGCEIERWDTVKAVLPVEPGV